MKLFNHTSKYLSLLLLPLITFWAIAFYYAMLDEIYDSLDDGLENQKILLLARAKEDPSILKHNDFDKHVYSFKPISKHTYKNFKSNYRDTLMYMYNEDDYEPVRIFESTLKQNESYYKLKIITSMVEEDDLIQDLVQYLIGLYILLVISILLLNNILLIKIWKPFYHSIAQLKNFKIEKGDTITTQPTSIDEFKLLNETITKLIRKSSDSFIEQKQFIENASHELQTPLAISINKLELFLENNIMSKQQTKELASILDNMDRLTRLNRSLLLLSKIENEQFYTEEQVNFSELTITLIEDFKDLALHKNTTLNFTENSAFHVNINRDLAQILLTNLIKNAIVHSKPNSEISMKVFSNSWVISNYSIEKTLDENLLFTRFKKTVSNKKSTGLGLPIAKAIAKKYGLQLSYYFDGLHNFKISLPKNNQLK